MTELADILPKPADGVTVRRARVIEVQGSSLEVDMGGGITIARLDSCNPVPGQQVYIISEGSSMTAIAAIGGPWRQSTVTVDAVSETDVQGLINGTATVIPKMGEFTPVVGDVLPLVWSGDGGAVWAGGKPGLEYVPPKPTAPPSSGGGGGGHTVTTGTATYSSTRADVYQTGFGSWLGINGVTQDSQIIGCFFYGGSRFRELQGRTIHGFRINAQRVSGSGTLHFYTHGYGSEPAGAPSLSNGPVSSNGSGWISLPVSMANWLISGSGTGGIAIFGAPLVKLSPPPYGALQFDWSR